MRSAEIANMLADFFRQYRTTILWQSLDFSDPDHAAPLEEAGFEVGDISESADQLMLADCRDFIVSNLADLIEHGDFGQAGHDFALTRNQHGAGFWDRGLGALGDRLTAASHAYGESSLYAGNDNWLYLNS